MSEPETVWVTTERAAEMLGVTSQTIRRMCKDGRLEHIRPHQRSYIETQSLQQLIADRDAASRGQ